jgi:hypothetical protein
VPVDPCADRAPAARFVPVLVFFRVPVDRLLRLAPEDLVPSRRLRCSAIATQY